MNCEQAKEEISAKIDGELDARALSELEGHLAGCAHCQGELEQYGRMEKAFQRYAAPPSATDFAQKVLRKTFPAPLVPLWRRPLLWKVAAAAVFVIGGIWVMTAERQGQVAGPEKEFVEESVDDELLRNLELIENLDLLQDAELALALNLSDEELTALLSSIEEG